MIDLAQARRVADWIDHKNADGAIVRALADEVEQLRAIHALAVAWTTAHRRLTELAEARQTDKMPAIVKQIGEAASALRQAVERQVASGPMRIDLAKSAETGSLQVEPDLTATETQVLDVLREEPKFPAEVVQAVSGSPAVIRKAIRTLLSEGKVEIAPDRRLRRSNQGQE